MADLQLHAANREETRQCFVNVFETWPCADNVAQHLTNRLNSPQHGWAEWYVGTIAGRVVVSLGAYPIRFRLDSVERSGILIGAVHTQSKFRGNGYASRLLEFVERQEAKAGRDISVLYSDINPCFYERLGYQICPSFGFEVGLSDARSWHARSNQTLMQGTWPDDLEQASELYNRVSRTHRFSVSRNVEYWKHLTERFPKAQIVWIGGREPAKPQILESKTERFGYAIFHRRGTCVEILDLLLSSTAAETIQSVCSALVRHIAQMKTGSDFRDRNCASLGSHTSTATRSCDTQHPAPAVARRELNVRNTGGTSACDKSAPRTNIDAKVESIRGWLPFPISSLATELHSAPRKTEITMIKALTEKVKLRPQAIESARWLQLTDHV